MGAVRGGRDWEPERLWIMDILSLDWEAEMEGRRELWSVDKLSTDWEL